MEIFGKKVHLRPYVCSPQGGQACQNSRVNLYVYASGFCPATCSFCPGFSSRKKIDLNKFREALTELHNKNVINRIGITGGEPLADLSILNDILSIINEVAGQSYHLSINTNGINLSKLRTLANFGILRDIHISRHSERDEDNSKIFGINTPTINQILQENEKGPAIFSLSCNLMKGQVDSVESLKSYLDMAIRAKAYQAGFVSLMEKTNLCKDMFIDYESISTKLMAKDGFSLDELSKDRDSCRCENFTYYNDHGSIPFYLRRVLGGVQDCVKAFVFDQDSNLVTNFGKDMVLL